MHNLPFDKPGRFWRGNLHTHSTLSDGRLSVEETCRVYRENGYHFLAITDHFMERYGFPLADTRTYRSTEFTTLLGAELHSGSTELGELWHILAVGLPLDFAPPAEDESGPQLAARALAAGAFVAAAHPAWYGLTEGDVLSLGDIHAVEIYNGVSADYNTKADSWYMLDLLSARGRVYSACATDDAHFNPERDDFVRGWVWVKSEALDPDALLAALKAGHYYSSTGPLIHDIQIKPGESIRVRCSPASSVFVTGSGWQAAQIHGKGLIDVELPLRRIQAPFCRVTVRDRYGECAWSSPIWFG